MILDFARDVYKQLNKKYLKKKTPKKTPPVLALKGTNSSIQF